ncbi:UNVERIFIED_CONTAM: tRNA ligase 1 [Sesamum radiatum]|uniref:tRNA ligase 1 n=1 Tax=Sesamum radiatum TaxID=300843 RepID=A0AAW2UME9_SESRA
MQIDLYCQNFYKHVLQILPLPKYSDSAFRRYQKEMRSDYEGRTGELSKETNALPETGGTNGESGKDDLADEDANLMIKLKFLTYKIRTFLIRNGLPILFKQGEAAYRTYYLRQMQKWNTSPAKQRALSKMLDEWYFWIFLGIPLALSEAEPFLEQYAKRSAQNQALVGAAGSSVRAEDFMAIVDGGDEEGDLEPGRDVIPSSPIPTVKETIRKDEGLIVFFPGIPGCAKSALCKEILNAPGGLGDDRPVRSLMGDLIKGKYWGKVAEERRKKPYSIMLADKNAPNEEVWSQIEDMCRSTKASAVPVVPDSEGTESNPFSLDALAVFIFRVLHRDNHPGNLDKNSPNAGYVLLMFYHLYDGKNRREFESELIERFGSLVKIPLLESNRMESTKGTYAQEWTKWEQQLRDTLFGNSEYLNSIQVPFEFAVGKVLEQLRAIAKGDYGAPSTEKRRFGAIVFAAVSLPVSEILSLLEDLGQKDPKVEGFLKDKNLNSSLTKAHVTLAHKRSHGVAAVASYGPHLHQNVPIHMNALLFSDKLAALEVSPGVVDGEKINSKNEWPHVTLWTAEGIAAKEANMLPRLFAEGKATRVEINPPVNITGVLEFF